MIISSNSLKLTRRALGVGELEVYFDPTVVIEEKIIFSKYVHEHLLQYARDVERLRHYVCPKCGTPVGNRDVAMKRLQSWLYENPVEAGVSSVVGDWQGRAKKYCEWVRMLLFAHRRDSIKSIRDRDLGESKKQHSYPFAVNQPSYALSAKNVCRSGMRWSSVLPARRFSGVCENSRKGWPSCSTTRARNAPWSAK